MTTSRVSLLRQSPEWNSSRGRRQRLRSIHPTHPTATVPGTSASQHQGDGSRLAVVARNAAASSR